MCDYDDGCMDDYDYYQHTGESEDYFTDDEVDEDVERNDDGCVDDCYDDDDERYDHDSDDDNDDDVLGSDDGDTALHYLGYGWGAAAAAFGVGAARAAKRSDVAVRDVDGCSDTGLVEGAGGALAAQFDPTQAYEEAKAKSRNPNNIKLKYMDSVTEIRDKQVIKFGAWVKGFVVREINGLLTLFVELEPIEGRRISGDLDVRVWLYDTDGDLYGSQNQMVDKDNYRLVELFFVDAAPVEIGRIVIDFVKY